MAGPTPKRELLRGGLPQRGAGTPIRSERIAAGRLCADFLALPSIVRGLGRFLPINGAGGRQTTRGPVGGKMTASRRQRAQGGMMIVTEVMKRDHYATVPLSDLTFS
jgi:hypothetical protein